ncbi:hypothetical protein K474DRAFT_1772687 [Panus rudis PR-1116 ss-1]|nr:hypothetical protein K474DRAFT_1772687 [Panus rudis PR-1116 ss-1]
MTVTTNDQRSLWREFKKCRRLRRWESVPVLKLLPKGRTLYVCKRCKSTNVFGIVCLWCTDSCEVVPAIGPVVRRRVSAPQLLSEEQKEQLRGIECRLTQMSISGSLVTAGDFTEPPDARRKRHRDAKVYSVEMLPAEECDKTADMYLQAVLEPEMLHRHGTRLIPSISMVTFSTNTLPESHGTPPRTLTSSLSAAAVNPGRTLRRKQRRSILRQRSSCSLRRKALSVPSHKRSQSELGRRTLTPIPQDHLDVPLGHTSRPLYTAIRKNMSRPTTPTRAPSPPFPDLASRGSRSLDLPTSYSASLLTSDSRYPSSYRSVPRTGYSLSGEVEMRMALAKSHTDDGICGSSSGYKFRDSVSSDFKTRRVGESGSMKGTVKRIRKGLKDLMTFRV